MAAPDGTVRFDTKVDQTGLKTGLSKLSSVIKTFGLTASIAAVTAGIVKMGKATIQAASDVEETGNKFNVTFSDIIDDANDAADALSEGFGLSSQKAQQLLSDTGDLLTGFGFTQESALSLSDRVNRLAADLASFTNYAGGAEGASAALTSGLLGEREAMKGLGIAITEADIKRLAEDKGIVGELDRQTKAMLTLELATTQSKNAIDDFKRSSDSYANVSRTAEAATEDLAAAIGKSLLPTATRLKSLYADMVSNLTEVIQKSNELEEARLAESEGTATLEQQLAILVARRERYTSATRAQKAALDAEIESIQGLIAHRQQQDSIEAALAENEAQRESARVAAAEAEEERQGALIGYLEEVADAYADTQEGKIEALEAEIAKFEEYEKTAVKTLPQVQAVLRDLREELKGMVEDTPESVFTPEAMQGIQDSIYETIRERIDREVEAELAAQEEIRQERLETAIESLSNYSSYASGISNIFSNLISSMTAGDDELTEHQRQNLLTLYRFQQAASIAQITIDTASAIARQYKDLPIYLAIPASVITAALGATQIAVVAATQPSFADGVWDLPGDTTAQLHQNEMVVPATFAESLRQAVSSSGSAEIANYNSSSASTGAASSYANLTVKVGDSVWIGPVQIALNNRSILVNESSVVYGR